MASVEVRCHRDLFAESATETVLFYWIRVWVNDELCYRRPIGYALHPAVSGVAMNGRQLRGVTRISVTT